MKSYTFLLILLVFIITSHSYSASYLGLGANYLIPNASFKDYNNNSFGFNIQLESRAFCKLWYGMRLDYYSLKKLSDTSSNYFDKAIYLSPQIRYNFISCENYRKQIIPYVQGLLTISSVSGTDEASRLGLGAAIGGGAVFSFELNKTCYMLDFNILYSAPNFIYSVDTRPTLKSLNFSLTFGVAI